MTKCPPEPGNLRASIRDNVLWYAKDSKNINSEVFLAEGNLGKGMNLPALENLSTMTIMVVLPWDDGSLVMKYMERCDQGLEV